MKSYISILLLFISSCKNINKERQFDVPDLKEHINKFIEAKKCFNKPTKLLLVNLNVRNDSLQVEIADTYPNIMIEKFRFDTIISEVRLIFTGEKIKGFSQNIAKLDYPRDILKTLDMDPDLMYEEFTLWVYLYKNGKLVYKEEPCSEIK
ncbi:hypothetical protein [Gynurincola endophyticus]|uniref:hypothetical protein n=1 Tax=Gynurincola endophyticus TaxID=2479004 RepID=UPI000F8DAE85|nr:hypothetical protein [Gynurincola endophyticus]